MPDLATIIKVNPVLPDPDIIQQAGKVLTQGGVVIFPAKCLYGVSVNALNQDAIQKVFHLKQRSWDKPLLLLVKDQSMIHSIVTQIPENALCLMDSFWPGNLTLVLPADSSIPDALTAGTRKIGVRIPSHPVARALVEAVDFPITGTSANLSGQPGCTSVGQLDPWILKNADLILDAGDLKGGKGSTIAEVSEKSVQVLREGEISRHQIDSVVS